MQRLAPLSAKWQRLRSETRDAASSWLFSPLARTDDPGIVETRALERDASTQWHLWQRLGTIEEIPQLTRLLAGAVFTSLVVPLSVAVHRGHLREQRDCAERSGRFAGMVRPTGLVGPVRLGSATTPLPARRARGSSARGLPRDLRGLTPPAPRGSHGG